MRRFKCWKSVDKTYQEQALIYGFCQCRDLPEVHDTVREKIGRLIREAGGDDAAALEAYLCTDAGWERVIMDYHLSESTLQRRVREFLMRW